MDPDRGKLFVFETTRGTSDYVLGLHFRKYGKVLETCVLLDKISKARACYGFVVFEDPSVLPTVLQDKHIIDGKLVKVKRPVPRVDPQQVIAGRKFGGSGNDRTKEIYVVGVPRTLSEGEFCHYFESYGKITNSYFLYESHTNLPRGYGVVSFESEDTVDLVLHKDYHDLGGKQVRVKRLLPEDGDGGGRSMGGGNQDCGCIYQFL